LLTEFGTDKLDLMVVISGDPAGAPATTDYCQKVGEKYGIENHIACDPDDSMAIYGKNGMAVIIDLDGIIRFKKQSPSISTLASQIESLLLPATN
jgi:hypothetical protein